MSTVRAERTVASARQRTDAGQARPRRLLVITCAAILVTAAALSSNSLWIPELLLVIPWLLAWHVRRFSMLVTVYLLLLGTYYGLTWLILREPRQPEVTALALVWTTGIATGCVIQRRRRRPTAEQVVLPRAAALYQLLTLFWANEIFDPARPDTYRVSGVPAAEPASIS